jgi:hypothetical protein
MWALIGLAGSFDTGELDYDVSAPGPASEATLGAGGPPRATDGELEP